MNIYIKKKNLLLRRIIVQAIILALLVIFLHIFQSQIKNSFYAASYPVSNFLRVTGSRTSAFFKSFLNAKELKNENVNLREKNQQLLSEISFLKESLKENLDSKEILDNNKSHFKLLLAKNSGIDIVSDVMLINRGSDDGILEGMPVISSQNVLYGKIVNVYQNFSQVMLISNKKSVVGVKISRSLRSDRGPSILSEQDGDSNKLPIHGVVRGTDSLSVYLDLVSFDAELKEGDVLVTSALDGIYPADFLVGTIRKKNKNDLASFQTAEIEPFFNVQDIENLFVVTNYIKK